MTLASFFSNIGSLLLFILSLCFLITIHELGHFSMAKLFKVYCKEFSIGFGPKLFSKKRKKGETYFSIRAIPLGGYVSMYGEGVEEGEDTVNIPKERSLLGIKKWKRAIIMVAGIFLNFVLGFVLFSVNRVAFAQPFATNQITIVEGSKIQEASGGDIKTGDYIISITKYYTVGGETSEPETIEVTKENLWDGGFTYDPETQAPKSVIDTATYIVTYAHTLDGETSTVTVTVNGIEKDTSKLFGLIKRKTITWDVMGVSSFYEYRHLGFAKGMAQAGKDWVEGCNTIGTTLGGLFIGQNWDQIGGPVAIFTTSSQVLNTGFGQYLYLWGLISVNLAIFNLLPFPGLDGWHFVVIIFEGIFRREMPEKAKNIISFVGMILLFGLMIFVTARDIIRL